MIYINFSSSIYMYIEFQWCSDFFFCEYLLWDVTAVENSVKFLTIYLIGQVDARFNYPNYRIGRWSITKERRKKWFHVKKFEQRNGVLLMNVLNFNTSRVQFYRNQTHINWNSILFFFFFIILDKEKNLFHLTRHFNQDKTKTSYSLINFSIVELSYPQD